MPRPRTPLDQIRELYRRAPAVECKGLCGHDCVPVEMSRAEAAHIHPDEPGRTNTGARGPLGQLRCEHLTSHGSCAVYARRPMICRIWGAAESMRCPHGCVPRPGHLSDAETMELVLLSLVVGGHSLVDDQRIAAALIGMTRWPGMAELVLRLVRGDLTAAAPLQQQLHRFLAHSEDSVHDRDIGHVDLRGDDRAGQQ